MPSTIAIVVHPSRIVREGLASILANSPFAPACSAPNIESVPSRVVSAGEQMLVLIGVPEGSDLIEGMVAAKVRFPDAHVVILGDPSNGDLVMTALTSGATTFVDENVPTSTLIRELDLITQGEPVISVSVLKRLLGHSSANPPEDAPVACAVDEPELLETQGSAQHGIQLSGREMVILKSLVDGASNKIIANQLKITEATVKVHIKAILRKIRVKNRTQAAIWALQRPLLPNVSHTGKDELPFIREGGNGSTHETGDNVWRDRGGGAH